MKEYNKYKISPEDLSFSIDSIKNTLGNDFLQNSSNIILINQLLKILKQEIDSIAYVKIYSNEFFQIDKNKIIVDVNSFNTEKIITSSLRKSEMLVFFIITLGEKIDSLIKNIMDKDDLLNGYVANLIASELIESAGDWLQNELSKKFEGKGMKMTNRYSPGYCNWNTSEQIKLFSLFSPNVLKVNLTESFMMVPLKSISGVFGLGKNVKKIEYQCNYCNDERCIRRNLNTKSNN